MKGFLVLLILISLISLWFTNHFKQKWISQLFFFLLAADRSNFLEQTTRPDFLLDPDHQRMTWPDQTRPHNRLCQTRPDQLSFLPQATHQSQHSLSVSLTLPQYNQPPPLGCHYHLLITGKVHSLCVCHGRLICKALDEPYQTFFPHTFGLKFLDFLFRLYLIVVREASRVPWAVKGLPCPFS